MVVGYKILYKKRQKYLNFNIKQTKRNLLFASWP